MGESFADWGFLACVVTKWETRGLNPEPLAHLDCYAHLCCAEMKATKWALVANGFENELFAS